MKYYFNFSVTAYEFLPYYRGEILSIVVGCTNGQRVEFPAMHMRNFLTSQGINGFFCMETKENKFLSLTKIH